MSHRWAKMLYLFVGVAKNALFSRPSRFAERGNHQHNALTSFPVQPEVWLPMASENTLNTLTQMPENDTSKRGGL